MKLIDRVVFGGFYFSKSFTEITANMKINTINVCFVWNCTYRSTTVIGVGLIVFHASYHSYPCAWIVTDQGIKYIEISS